MRNKALLDLLLFPASTFRKITNRKFTFYTSIIIVGIIDILGLIIDNFEKIAADRSGGEILANLALSCLIVVIIGFLDIIFFSVPLIDLIKSMKKQKVLQDRASQVIKLAKVYIVSHFIIIPVQLILYFGVKAIGIDNMPYLLLLVAALVELAIPFWSSAIITRGAGVVFKLEGFQKVLFFIVTMIWNDLLGYALGYLLTFAGKIMFGL